MFQARLCPLNMVWPNIPLSEEYRPIVVLSPLYKFFLKVKYLFNLKTRQKSNRFLKINVNLGQYLATIRENKTIFS
jgi:hypothetical protein